MNNQAQTTRLSIALNMIGLVLTVILAVSMTFVMVGCSGGNKVSSEDEQLRRLQRNLAATNAAASEQALDILALNNAIVSLNVNISALANTANNQQQVGADLQNQINALLQYVADLTAQLATLNGAQTSTQTTVNSLIVQLAVLQGYTSIVAILDPCGDAVGIVDEVLLKLSDGRILASYSDNSSGQNTRFAVLSNGNYVTTDGSHCAIHVQNGAVTW